MIKREYKDIFVSQQEYNLVYEEVGNVITSTINIEQGDYVAIYSENDREKKRPLYAICLGVSIMESSVHNRWQAQVRLINNKDLKIAAYTMGALLCSIFVPEEEKRNFREMIASLRDDGKE